MEQRKREALSIPNLITYFRMLLIPAFVLAYFEGHYVWALVCLAMSGLSDVADGYIARHYNMVTDLGKVIDPVADKLTQAAMIFSVAWHAPAVWLLLGLLVVKELMMLFWGGMALRTTGTVNSARWYGKVCTFVLYASMVVFLLWPGISPPAAHSIVALCAGVMLMSLVLYSIWYIRFIRQNKTAERQPLLQNSMLRSQMSLVITQVIVVVLLVCCALAFVYRGNLTVESIIRFTPENLWLAALVFMGLYAAKSLAVVVYLKIIYVAAGMVFPLPVAMAVNIVGTILELSIPYAVGHFGGRGTAELILQRRPKLRQFSAMRRENDLWFSIILRAVGVIPADPVSIYLGACGTPYGTFLLGSMLGLLPGMVITTFMGIYLENPGSPGFIIATALFVAVDVTAAVVGAAKIGKSKGLKGDAENELTQ